jgi:methyl-accepting chemotaxis protein
MGDQFHLSGDFRGAILNIKSTLTNVRQTAGQIPGGDPESRRELQDLIDQLSAELEKVPPEKKEDAEAIAETTKLLIDQAKSEKPNKTLLGISGEGLKQAASKIADVLPTVITIATQIAATVARFSGG